MKKRLISLLLALVTIFSLLPTSASASSNQDRVWDYLKSKGFSDAGAAGIMGNIQQESGYRPNNLEDRYESSIGMTDAEYTAAVDNGSYKKESFVHDSAGYGLCQWTFHTRKEALYNYAKNTRKASIGDLTTQLDFMCSEMSPSLTAAMKEATDVQDACLKFHNEYEQSADTESMKQNRVRYALAVYDAYSPKGQSPADDSIIITNYNYPRIVEEGKSFSLYGTVISGKSDISCLTVGVYNSSGTMVTGKIVNPGMRTYGISMVDPFVKFGTLSVGTYYYRVTAINFSDSVQVLNKKFTVVKEHTHSYGAEWKTDDTKHWHECACGAESGAGVHTYGSWTVSKAPTCLKEGISERRCTVCGYKQSKTVGKSGHNYVEGVCSYCGDTVIAITSQPADVSAKTGDNAVFSVTASGSGLTYQWQFKKPDESVWNKSSSLGAKTAKLTIEAWDYRDGQQYRCVITDANGNKVTSNAATLTVLPIIKSQPKSLSAKSGDNAVFSVTATGSGLTYQWQYKAAGGSAWNKSSSLGAKTAKLTVEALDYRDGQQYRCVITDAKGNKVTSNAATLTVLPVIKSQPKDVSAKSGDNAVFSVTASGSGLTYQWQYKAAGGSAWNTSSSLGAKTAKLTVEALAYRDGQQYRCVITDTKGNKVTSSAVTLTILPTIKTQPKDASVNAGDNAVFSVTASGSGLTYQWQFKKPGESVWNKSSSLGAKTAKLTVEALDYRDGQQYRCVITDAKGNKVTSNAATLTILPTIKTQPEDASAKAGDNAVFSVAASGNGLAYQWQYKSADGNYWKSSTASGAKTNKLTVEALSYRNGQQYRCVITDAKDNRVTSSAATLTVK